jgi:hypothetical protein
MADLEPCIERLDYALGFPSKNNNSGVLTREIGRNIWGSIRGAVVDNDHFKVRKRLLLQTSAGGADCCSTVEYRQ